LIEKLHGKQAKKDTAKSAILIAIAGRRGEQQAYHLSRV